MKCIVTGGAGFIGSHLVDRLLSDGHDVLVLDNLSTGRIENLDNNYWNSSYFLFREADISKVRLTAYFMEIDWVFHLAGKVDIVPSIKRPLDYFEANVKGTLNILEASRLAKVEKFIYASSSSCYGIPNKYPTPEEALCSPQYPYALTKYLGEQLVQHWHKVYKLPTASLRLFNVYGPRSRTTGAYGAVLGVFLKQKLEGRPCTIVGDGKQKRDFVYVSDVVDAFVKAAESPYHGGAYNIGSGKPQSILELSWALGFDDVEYVPERPGEPKITHADISSANRILKWEPKVSFKDGIEILLKRIEDWRDAPLWTSESIEEATKEWFKYLGGRE